MHMSFYEQNKDHATGCIYIATSSRTDLNPYLTMAHTTQTRTHYLAIKNRDNARTASLPYATCPMLAERGKSPVRPTAGTVSNLRRVSSEGFAAAPTILIQCCLKFSL